MMFGYVAIAFLAAVSQNGDAASPVRVTIDCGSHERNIYGRSSHRLKSALNSRFDVNSFCNLIHGAIPKTIKDGRFVLREPDIDQTGFSDTLVPLSAPPPEGFIPKFALPKFRVPKLKVPKINVPRLKANEESFSPPKVGSSTYFPSFRSYKGEESSAERMERFKKGVQKMLHVVKVLGQIDQYLSDRTRILIDKLAKTFAD